MNNVNNNIINNIINYNINNNIINNINNNNIINKNNIINNNNITTYQHFLLLLCGINKSLNHSFIDWKAETYIYFSVYVFVVIYLQNE